MIKINNRKIHFQISPQRYSSSLHSFSFLDASCIQSSWSPPSPSSCLSYAWSICCEWRPVLWSSNGLLDRIWSWFWAVASCEAPPAMSSNRVGPLAAPPAAWCAGVAPVASGFFILLEFWLYWELLFAFAPFCFLALPTGFLAFFWLCYAVIFGAGSEGSRKS